MGGSSLLSFDDTKVCEASCRFSTDWPGKSSFQLKFATRLIGPIGLEK